MDKDEFEAWKQEPITRLFLKGLANYGGEARSQFADQCWAGSYLTIQEQVWLANLRGRSDTADFFSLLSFEEFEGLFAEE